MNNIWLNPNDSDLELVTGTPGSLISVIPSVTPLKPWYVYYSHCTPFFKNNEDNFLTKSPNRSGARATLGVHKGKYWWTCRVEALSGPASGLRVGWSTLKSSLQLGQVSECALELNVLPTSFTFFSTNLSVPYLYCLLGP